MIKFCDRTALSSAVRHRYVNVAEIGEVISRESEVPNGKYSSQEWLHQRGRSRELQSLIRDRQGTIAVGVSEKKGRAR